MGSTRVFVIGLDGATFDLLDPWLEKGHLPNLRKMMKHSTYGRLGSTIPPVTPPAWTSFMTGVNPGKHGVFDFITFRPNSYEKVLVNSSYVRSKWFWDLAGEKGKKSIILYVPLTYPPRKVEGVMISGIPAPTKGEFIYPKEIGGELEVGLGRWWAEADGDKLEDFHEETFLSEIYQTLETRFRVANYLMTKEWNLFVLVIMETDWVQHFLWGEKDRCLLPLYMKIDGMIGQFMEFLKDEDSILILSDHGFGTVRKTFYMNVWLREKGFLVSRRERGSSRRNLDMGFFHREKEPFIIQKIKGIWSKKRFEIHWGKTQAYFINTGYGYGIRINLMGREPEGIVKPEEYHELRNQIIEELNLLVDEESGRRIFERVYPREDVYWGPYAKNAPDIVFLPHGEYTLNDRVKDKILKKSKAGKSSHRLEGILILQGPWIKKGERITGVHIMDVPPTILYLLGLPVFKGFDGKVLTEALKPEVLKAYPIRTEDIPLEIEASEHIMNEAEEKEMKKKLQGLGYMS
jgi:predicted AlkP superfamily phosphohydrolase/phosphomutase